VIEALEYPERFTRLREQTRRDVAARFGRYTGLMRYRELVNPGITIGDISH
jgi:hypothetical protein